MDSLRGGTLLKADGSKHNADTVMTDADIILYYFSAHWCPPCRNFTPKLKDFYKETSSLKVEIVFVSSDKTYEDMISYMKESHGDWYAVEHNSDLSRTLDTKYDVKGIPTLVVCKKDGSVVTKEGRADVSSDKPSADVIQAWKTATAAATTGKSKEKKGKCTIS